MHQFPFRSILKNNKKKNDNSKPFANTCCHLPAGFAEVLYPHVRHPEMELGRLGFVKGRMMGDWKEAAAAWKKSLFSIHVFVSVLERVSYCSHHLVYLVAHAVARLFPQFHSTCT